MGHLAVLERLADRLNILWRNGVTRIVMDWSQLGIVLSQRHPTQVAIRL